MRRRLKTPPEEEPGAPERVLVLRLRSVLAGLGLGCANSVLAAARGAARPPTTAYTVSLDAHSRCAGALAAWRSAAVGARAEAYRAYPAALQREELAAAGLERLNPPRLRA